MKEKDFQLKMYVINQDILVKWMQNNRLLHMLEKKCGPQESFGSQSSQIKLGCFIWSRKCHGFWKKGNFLDKCAI